VAPDSLIRPARLPGRDPHEPASSPLAGRLNVFVLVQSAFGRVHLNQRRTPASRSGFFRFCWWSGQSV
jgi:hypothetical protein